MRKIIATAIFVFAISIAGAQTKGFINREKEFSVTAPLVSEHKFYGYEKPDERSKKVIIFSRFVGDNKNKYANLPLGAYVETANLKPGNRIVFESIEGGFAKLNFISPGNKPTVFYVNRRYIETAQ